MKPTRLVTALAVTAALTLAGCSDDPDPKLAPSTDQSTTSPTEPSDTPSEPDESRGPLDTTSAWVAALSALTRTGDAEEVEALSAPDCKGCRYAIDPILKIYSDGGSIRTSGVQIEAMRIKSRNGGTATVTAGLIYGGGTTIPRSGAEPIDFAEDRKIAEFRLTRSDGDWRVSFLGYLS